MDIWDNMKGALIGVAATKFRTFLDEAVPGFAEQYRKTEQEKAGSAADPTPDMQATRSVPAM